MSGRSALTWSRKWRTSALFPIPAEPCTSAMTVLPRSASSAASASAQTCVSRPTKVGARSSAVEGAAAKPTLKPPFPFERGLGGAPTLVQNTETLAHLALIARFGAGWFRSLGTEAEPGSALVTLSGAVTRPGVYEIELGTPLSEVVAQAGGTQEPVNAFLVGGYFGAWTRDEQLQLTAANGLGAGVVIALPASACALRVSARVARYLADASAGQCGPCRHGLPALATGLERIVAGEGGDRRDTLNRWARQVSGRGACRHPDGAARFVQSTLSVFADEIATHLRNGRCTAGAQNGDPTPTAWRTR